MSFQKSHIPFPSKEHFSRKRRTHRSWREALHFFSRFLVRPHAVGSVWPSSHYLAAAMLRGVPLKSGDLVVEYGPGTGPFTSLLQHYVAQGVNYLGIERDQKFYKKLKERFPEMKFYHGSAEELPELLKKYNLPQATLVISGLPFAAMPAPLQKRILEATQQCLSPEGYFRTFVYLMSVVSPHALHFLKNVEKRFHYQHKKTVVMLNIPPARVLSFSHPIKCQ